MSLIKLNLTSCKLTVFTLLLTSQLAYAQESADYPGLDQDGQFIKSHKICDIETITKVLRQYVPEWAGNFFPANMVLENLEVQLHYANESPGPAPSPTNWIRETRQNSEGSTVCYYGAGPDSSDGDISGAYYTSLCKQQTPTGWCTLELKVQN